jgi:hypothetical protein
MVIIGDRRPAWGHVQYDTIEANYKSHTIRLILAVTIAISFEVFYLPQLACRSS